MKRVCDYFSLLLLNYCGFPNGDKGSREIQKRDFEVIHQWQFLNYTWPSYWSYTHALENFQYIPENNAPTGVKIYGGKIFLSIPRFRPGIPATLAHVTLNEGGTRTNELLKPFPNWELNINRACIGFQSVQSMEIDRQGYMWVIDGVRINEATKCPSKLVILDLRKNGRIIHRYNFPNEISLTRGGFLNDIVLDESNGGFAYITDNSVIDPGLIVYSLKRNKAWKLRDPSFFAEPRATGFVVNGLPMNNLSPIDGIALSPAIPNRDRFVYFCSLTGINLYSISTSILKNETFSTSDKWRQNINLIGQKEAQSDGLIIDNEGNLFYTLLPLYGIGKWNINNLVGGSKIIYKNEKTMVWPDTFAMDEKGYLYVISNNINQFIDPKIDTKISSDAKFRIFRYFTGTKSYMYSV
ncbi:hypothetical protein HHI36_019241 [Cryptolaemus montrouzieri]|uniref:Uncharacterized protein n=1 Tax=Cryptolaemus montrouzieri TaxID=559131 RepID=A0ABD2P334_9CUCU